MTVRRTILLFAISLLAVACGTVKMDHEIVIVDPGHVHAALVLKYPVPGVSDTVRVFAPEGPELTTFVNTINSFNSRENNPTSWVLDIKTADNFLDVLPEAKKGAFVVLSGKNRLKSQEINVAVSKGYNVLADKPMAIAQADYEILKHAYAEAARRKLVIYDLMTERYETLNMISRDIMGRSDIFGTPESVDIEDVHYFLKGMAGSTLRRPQWYYDVTQQGEGIADVTTHFIDLALWQCFPGVEVNPSDVNCIDAVHFPTTLTFDQYSLSTGAEAYPDYLQRCVKDGILSVYSNGILCFNVKGVDVKIKMIWDFKAPEGSSDSFKSSNTGTLASLHVKQDADTQYKRSLFVHCGQNEAEKITSMLEELYPGAILTMCEEGIYLVDTSGITNLNHESHFNRVVATFIEHLDGKKVPAWERANTLTKYYITTVAVSQAREQ